MIDPTVTSLRPRPRRRHARPETGLDTPELPAFVDGTTGAALTFGELHEQVLRIAAAPARRGIGRGDLVALHAPNSPAWAAVFHGVLRANATVTTLYTVGEAAAQLVDSRARMVVTTGALRERAQAAAKEAGVDEVVVVDDADDLLACAAPRPFRRSARTTSPCCPIPPAPPGGPRA